MMYYGDMSGWGFALMGISAVVFWGLVIVGIVLLVRYFGRSRQPPTAARTSEQLLAERFARGEIDKSEYQARLATLRGPNRDRRGGRTLPGPVGARGSLQDAHIPVAFVGGLVLTGGDGKQAAHVADHAESLASHPIH
jgi:putative membrane protein